MTPTFYLDTRPANVLIERGENAVRAKLCDFGISALKVSHQQLNVAKLLPPRLACSAVALRVRLPIVLVCPCTAPSCGPFRMRLRRRMASR